MHKIFAAALFAVVFWGCSTGEKPRDLTRGKTGKQKQAGAETAQVAERKLSSSVRLPGQLKPFQEVNIVGKVNGFVKDVLVDLGSQVKKGQILITLQAPEMDAQLQEARSRYFQAQQQAEASRERFRRLSDAAGVPGSVSPLDLYNAKSKMKADEEMVRGEQSNMQSVKTMLSYLTIRAPFDGYIVSRNVNPGALVGPSSKGGDGALLVLQQLQKLRLQVSIPEAYVDKVNLGKTVSYVFNTSPGVEHSAHISRTANALGSLRSEAIEIDVINQDKSLKPGMYAEVRIPLLTGAKSLLVPNNAIITSTERQYVVTVRNGKAQLVDVKEGLTTTDSTEVFGNIKANEHILLHPGDDVKEGDKINL
ncbi:MAG: efflux RND transporter periplasmic adaptor subunit [Mucilaginibacter polytrichastri]|nr:efflux RND transporter periplasmic adaptor subunit [Mucilaginibacter polytrichastri]